MTSELFIFARFHAKEGSEQEVAAAIHEVLGPTPRDPREALALLKALEAPVGPVETMIEESVSGRYP